MKSNLEASAERFQRLAARLRKLGADHAPIEGGGISPSHMALLEYIASNEGCGVRETAQGLNLATPTISIAVNQLEKDGLIARQPHPDDGRAVRLFLTQKGEKVYQQAYRFYSKKFEQLLTGLTPDERETLLSLLERAIQTAEEKFQGEEQ